jgi:peptidoglycan hydrolase-like protein with peptidoglycan-binding domain
MRDATIRRMLAASASALIVLSAPAFAQQQQPQQDQAQQDQAQQDQAQQDEAQQDEAQQVEEVPEGLAAALYLSVEDVRAVQQALQQAGHDPGTTDGLWGDQSRSAMRDFQQEEGIPASGNIDFQSLRALQLFDTVMGEGAGPDAGMQPRTQPDAPTPGAQPGAPDPDQPQPGEPGAPGQPGQPGGPAEQDDATEPDDADEQDQDQPQDAPRQ